MKPSKLVVVVSFIFTFIVSPAFSGTDGGWVTGDNCHDVQTMFGDCDVTIYEGRTKVDGSGGPVSLEANGCGKVEFANTLMDCGGSYLTGNIPE